MALQKKGLGRGLDALLDPYSAAPVQAEEAGIKKVSVRDIDNNLEQPRKQFDEQALNDLASSIKTHGIVQPLIVKEKNGRYMIIAGERRFRAARLAGLTEVPVIVADYDEAQIHEVSLIENIQREDLNPIEEAAAIRFLMQQHDMTQDEVSKRIGKSRPAVANALRLLQLPEKTLLLLKSGELSAGHGRALAGLSDAKMIEKLTDEAVRMGYSVRALEARVKNINEGKAAQPTKPKAVLSPALSAFEEGLRDRLGTKVKINGGEAKGKIVIEYYNKEDLQHIYECILQD